MNHLNVPVEEFTTPDPITAPESMPVEDMAQLMKEFGIRHLPVKRQNKIVGLISQRDLNVVMALDVNKKMMLRARDLMITNLATIRSSASLDEAAFQMSSKKIGSLLVYDNADNFLGIFTATDALNALIEIVRENQF